MKHGEHIMAASKIGSDSWALLNFENLPRNASRKRQIEALHADQRWLRNHTEEICHQIDKLIREIEGE
jgi:hypothetical protein